MLKVFTATLTLAIFELIFIFHHHVLLLFAIEVVEILLFDISIDFLFDNFENLIMIKTIKVSGVTATTEIFLLLVNRHVLVLVLVVHFSRSVLDG